MRINSYRAVARIQLQPPRTVRPGPVPPKANLPDIVQQPIGVRNGSFTDIRVADVSNESVQVDVRIPAGASHKLADDIRLAENRRGLNQDAGIPAKSHSANGTHNINGDVYILTELRQKASEGLSESEKIRGEFLQEIQVTKDLRLRSAENLRHLADVNSAVTDESERIRDDLTLRAAEQTQQAANIRGQFQKDIEGLKDFRNNTFDNNRGLADANRANFHEGVRIQSDSSQRFSADIRQSENMLGQFQVTLQGLDDLRDSTSQSLRGLADANRVDFHESVRVQSNAGQSFSDDIRQSENVRGQFQEQVQGLDDLRENAVDNTRREADINRADFVNDVGVLVSLGQEFAEDIRHAESLRVQLHDQVQGRANINRESFQEAVGVQADSVEQFSEDIGQAKTLRGQIVEELQGLKDLLNNSTEGIRRFADAARDDFHVDISIQKDAGMRFTADIELAYDFREESLSDARNTQSSSQSIWMV